MCMLIFVDGKRFAGLNICCFSVIEVFTEILSRCLGHSAHYLVQLKRDTYIHGTTFVILPRTVKNVKV